MPKCNEGFPLSARASVRRNYLNYGFDAVGCVPLFFPLQKNKENMGEYGQDGEKIKPGRRKIGLH